MKNEPFVIERTFNAPIEKVWKAITDKDQMKQWYFDIAEFKPEVGFEFEFYGQGHKGENYRHLCKITEVEVGRKLTYSWRYDGNEGNSFVTFELFDEGEKTKLRLTHRGLETFPVHPDFAKESFAEGWTYLIGTSIKEFVETTTVKKSIEIKAAPAKVWDVLVNPVYTKQWGNEFSEGTRVETDWKKGSDVLWKDKEGYVGAKGIVTANDFASLLKVSFYDDVKTEAPAPTGEYTEAYSLSSENGKTVLAIEAGPLSVKDSKSHAPLWDKAIEKMKALAEG